MEKQPTGKCKNILEIIYKITAIFGLVVLCWYTYETYLIRINSQKQLEFSVRPYLDFYSNGKTAISIFNKSKNPALNSRFILIVDNKYYLSNLDTLSRSIAPDDGLDILQLDANGTINLSKLSQLESPTNLYAAVISDGKLSDTEEIKRAISILTKNSEINFFTLLGGSKFTLMAIYEDLYGNKLYTISGDFEKNRSTKTGYFKDLVH